MERLGSGDPVILLHGYGASSTTWLHWAPELARDHAVHLVDMRGFGSAPKPRGAVYAPRDLADDVVRMMLELDLTNATLVGHSLGGGVALLVALAMMDRGERGRVARLVVVDGTAYAQSMPKFVGLLRRRWTRLALRVAPTRWLIGAALRSIVFDPEAVTPEQVERYARPLRSWAGKRAAVASALQLVPDDLDGITARYPLIDVPTLVLWGRRDPVVPLRNGERLARELPRARMVVLERCGHLLPEERPEEGLRAVKAFLEEGRADGAPAPPA